MQKVVPCLWFNSNADEAIDYYASIFKDIEIGERTYYDAPSAEVSGQAVGDVMTIEFELFCQKFLALNGGPEFKFTEAISFIVNCDDQAEIDYYWDKLTADGEPSQCGWLKDKYGVSWQITPANMNELLADPDQEKVKRAMETMLSMNKLDIAQLEQAKS